MRVHGLKCVCVPKTQQWKKKRLLQCTKFLSNAHIFILRRFSNRKVVIRRMAWHRWLIMESKTCLVALIYAGEILANPCLDPPLSFVSFLSWLRAKFWTVWETSILSKNNVYRASPLVPYNTVSPLSVVLLSCFSLKVTKEYLPQDPLVSNSSVYHLSDYLNIYGHPPSFANIQKAVRRTRFQIESDLSKFQHCSLKCKEG